MANIKNFGLSGISADVQFGKAGGRVVYDAGNSVFKVTQADGSTLDNIRVATTPAHANDAASKAYVDSKSGSDSAAVQAELDATQTGAGLGTDGTYSANGTANYIASSTSLKDADNDLDAALKAEETARIVAVSAEAATRLANDNTLQSNIDSEESARIAADNALDARLDIVEGGVAVEGSIAKAEADAKAYTDAEIDSLDTSLRNYIDTEVAAKDNTDEITEGSVNLFFTQARARASISVTDNGGDGALSYNSSTGVITYTGPSAAEVRAHFSGGTGVTITNGVVAIGQDVGTTANVTFGSVTTSGNVTIGGALTVQGDATFLANITGNTMGMTGDLTVTGNTNLKQLTTVTSLATKSAGSNATNVFQVVSSDAQKLFEVRQNGDAIIGGTLTVNGGAAALNGNLTTSGNATVDGNLDVNGSLTVAGDATFTANIYGNNMTLSGNLIVGDADTDFVEFNADVASDFIPDVTGTYDLGTATKEWNNVYANNVYADLTGDVTGQISDITNHAAYIKGLLSAVDAGGDGSFSYDSATGAFTYTGPSAAEVRAHLSAGTGVSYSNGQFSIGQAVGTTDNVTFNDVTVNGSLYSNDITATEVVITGNLVVNGTTTTVNTETIALSDNTIVLNSNATGAATQDAGLEVERGTDANVSLLWDETSDRWTVGAEDFVAANFIGDLIGDVTGTVSDISNHDTDALAEGSTNLYYTDGRVAAYLTTNAYATEAYTDAAVADKNSFVVRGTIGTSGSIGTIVNVSGHTYYVSRITVKVTSAYDATVSVSDGTNTLMTAAEIEEDVVGTYVAELPFATATAAGATISLVSAATAGAALVTVEYVQL